MRRVLCVMLLAGAVGLLPAAAFGLLISGEYDITSGGLTSGGICRLGAQCTGGTGDFLYAPPGGGFDAATGTITVDAEAQTLAIEFVISGASFVDRIAPLNGVDQVLFGSVSYSGTGLSYTEDSGQAVVTGSITVTGTYEQLLGGELVVGATDLNSPANVSSGICNDTGALVCTFGFGPGGPTVIDINGTNRRFLHGFTVDPIILVPEPSTVLLVGAGLLALRSRSRRGKTD